MKWFEKFFNMFSKLKDWRIALMIMIMFCFTMYCLFFGGIKQISDYFEEPIKIENANEGN